MSCYRKYVTYYNFDMLEFPVAIKDITKFENKNKISINVYGLEEAKYGEYRESTIEINNSNKWLSTQPDNGIIYPLKVCKKEIVDRHVNLLVTEKDGVFHYSTITQFSRLVGSQLSAFF